MPSSISSSTAVDLSRLPAPSLVEELNYEAILTAMRNDLTARDPAFDALVEGDPAMKVLQVAAFRELLLRQRINDASRSVMIAYAAGADLDNLGVLFGVARRELTAADEQAGTPAVMEDDEDLRRRILLAPDSYSVAGPASAYVYHALSADGDVADASATSPVPGKVVVSLLARNGDGTAPSALTDKVYAALSADDVRPLTDQVDVRSAQIVNFDIDARLTLYPGPDAVLIAATAEQALARLLDSVRRIGIDVTRSALFAALHVAGVQKVELLQPAADIVIDNTQAAYAATRSITIAGTAA